MNAMGSAWRKSAGWVVRSFCDNPVVTKELRTRMRGWKAFTVMGGYVLFLAMVLLIHYSSLSASRAYYSQAQYSTNELWGLALATTLMWTQTILLTLIIPALTAGALSSEIEHKTIELLALTRLTAGRVVLGKLLSTFLYALMLIVCSVPLAGMCIMFGGMAPAEMTSAYFSLIAWAFLLVSIGVFWSSMFEKTVAATMFAYGSSGLYFLAISIAGAYLHEVTFGYHSTHTTDSIPALLTMSPAWAPSFILYQSEIFGLKIASTIGGMVFHIGMGLIFLLTAAMHVRYKPADRALPIRLLIMGITVWMYFLLIGDRSFLWTIFSGSAAAHAYTIASTIIPAMILLACSTLVFATGPIRRQPNTPLILYVLSPTRIFRSDMGGTIGFMFLWACVTSGAIMAAYAWGSSVYAVPLSSYCWRVMIGMCSVLTALSIGLGATGVLVSSIVRRRREAVGIMVVAVGAIFAVYSAIWGTHAAGYSNPTNPIWQLAAFWPLTPWAMTLPEIKRSFPPIMWSGGYSWLVVTSAYLGIAVSSLVLASIASIRLRGIRED